MTAMINTTTVANVNHHHHHHHCHHHQHNQSYNVLITHFLLWCLP
jgi:hypothetical protein